MTALHGRIVPNMTLAEFKEKVQKDDPAIMANLMRISAQVKGTRAYFKRESQKLGRHVSVCVCVCVFWEKIMFQLY